MADFAFHPKVSNPDRWEIIKREAEKGGRDPYEDLKKHAQSEQDNKSKFKLRGGV